MNLPELSQAERESAFRWACARGRLVGGHATSDDVIWNEPRVSKLLNSESDKREIIEAALDRNRGNVRAAARELSVSHTTIYRAFKRWEKLAGLLLFVLCPLLLFGQVALPYPKATAVTNTVPQTFPLPLAWNYYSNVPPFTVIECTTNTGPVQRIAQPSVLGTNRCLFNLPPARWTVRAWGTDERTNTGAVSIQVNRALEMIGSVTDLLTGSNRVIYTGPRMPGRAGRVELVTREKWEQQ